MGSCGRGACNLAKAVCPQVPRERAGGCAWLAELGEYLLRREELVQRFVARADRCAIVAGVAGLGRPVPNVGLAECVALLREDSVRLSEGLTAMLAAAFDLGDRCAIVAGAEGSARVVPIVGLAGCVALPREDLAGSSAGLTAMLGAAFDLAVLRWTVPLGDFVEWPEA